MPIKKHSQYESAKLDDLSASSVDILIGAVKYLIQSGLYRDVVRIAYISGYDFIQRAVQLHEHPGLIRTASDRDDDRCISGYIVRVRVVVQRTSVGVCHLPGDA